MERIGAGDFLDPGCSSFGHRASARILPLKPLFGLRSDLQAMTDPRHESQIAIEKSALRLTGIGGDFVVWAGYYVPGDRCWELIRLNSDLQIVTGLFNAGRRVLKLVAQLAIFQDGWLSCHISGRLPEGDHRRKVRSLPGEHWGFVNLLVRSSRFIRQETCRACKTVP